MTLEARLEELELRLDAIEAEWARPEVASDPSRSKVLGREPPHDGLHSAHDLSGRARILGDERDSHTETIFRREGGVRSDEAKGLIHGIDSNFRFDRHITGNTQSRV